MAEARTTEDERNQIKPYRTGRPSMPAEDRTRAGGSAAGIQGHRIGPGGHSTDEKNIPCRNA